MHFGSSLPDCLDHDPFKAIVAPRPIGWIGTRNREGTPNLGPYSFFGAVSYRPHMVYFSSEGPKHSYRNALSQGEFTVSLVSEALVQGMNVSSAALPDGADEFAQAGLSIGQSVVTNAPFVAESPAALECVTTHSFELIDRSGNKTGHFMVFGEVVQTHIRQDFIRNGRYDSAAARPVLRLGYRDYTTVATAWELMRPDD